MNILCLADYFLPGYKAGGPIRTLSNLLEKLGDEFHFAIVTRDRDLGDLTPYQGIKVDSWQIIDKAEACYLSPSNHSFRGIRDVILSKKHDVLYLNSFFSPFFTFKPLLLRRLRLIPDMPVVLAPRGEFSSGALALKRFKKQVYINLSKLIGLYRNVIWQASSEYEKKYIRERFGKDVCIEIAPNFPPTYYTKTGLGLRHKKNKGRLKTLFLSRISHMKNLDGALKILKGMNAKIQLSIYGPIENKSYWKECQLIINQLPDNIDARYSGAVRPEQVASVLMKHDLLFLPTLGENYGQIIVEAFMAGCPVLISDRTPWRGLEKKGVGWDLPLEEPEEYQSVLEKCADMNEAAFSKLVIRAHEYGMKLCMDQDVVERTKEVFCKAFYQKEM
jgi:glycosyltransferase involved in cell wall biosynthesis